MMQLTFLPQLSPAQRREWNGVVDQAAGGTPYQLAEFYDWWHDLGTIDREKSGFFVGQRDNSICFCALGFYKQLQDGQQVYEFERGPVANTLPDLIEGLTLLREAIDGRIPLLMGPHLPYDATLESTFRAMGYVRTNRRWYDASVIIDLTPSREEIFASFPADTRYVIRKSEKRRRMATLEESEEACQIYTRMHNDLSSKIGCMPVHPEYVYRIVKSDQRGKLFFLRDASGKVLAGAVIIATRKLAWYHRGASVKETPAHAQYLHWNIMQWCKENAISSYQLGGIDLGQPQHSVNRFKLSLAAAKRPVVLMPLFYHGTGSPNTERGYQLMADNLQQGKKSESITTKE